MLHTMSAAWPERGFFVHKAYAAAGGTIRFRVFLYDYETGRILAVMEGNRLGQMRTGAATAVAARRLAPTEPGALALFGTGLQAWGQLEALMRVTSPSEVRVYSRDEAGRRAFAERATAAFDVAVTPATDPAECVADASIVVTATTSKDPVFPGSSLTPGGFVAAVGANLRIKRELDGKALQRIDRIIVDDLETARRESGLLLTPMEAGFMHWSEIESLPRLAAEMTPPRRTEEETLCFHSLGSATWDLASAMVAWRRATAAGAGREIPLD
jgi:ornithine cyclodeaminase/alanine dehydrogenase-like protein (mu-crystallin family)